MRVLLIVALGIAAILADESQLLHEFSDGNHQFTANVYRELRKTESGSFLVCPLSAEIILALVHAGAGGKTAQELSNGLHLPESREKIKQTIQELTLHLQGNEHYTLSSANKIYIKDGYVINNGFKSTAVSVFQSEIQNIDFNKAKQAAAEMNKWVEEKTHEKIKDLVKSTNLNEDTRAVLINAMYFHGKWAVSFDKKATRKRTFHVNQQDQREINMMEQTAYLKHHESLELNAKFLELSYSGDDVTMTFVLPNDKEGLSTLEANINKVFVTPDYITDLVHVVIPKFKIETAVELNNILKALGIIEAFTPAADFREILIGQQLSIDQVIQKTFIEVEEEGTTAAAATAVFMDDRSLGARQSHIDFIADHPFIFYIKIKDVVAFAGKYSAPTD